jgi:hypothetical protein
VGWSIKTPEIIYRYSKYLAKGSKIDVFVPETDEDAKKEFTALQKKNSELKMSLFVGDLHKPQTIEKLKYEQYDSVIILSRDGENSELRDSESIANLLEFRYYFKTFAKKEFKTQLITEVADYENIEVIHGTGVRDFLISNQLVSKIYAQASRNTAVLQIYENLFSEGGSEVCIKPISRYLACIPEYITFGELCADALNDNESCFRVRIGSEEMKMDKNFGIYLNPSKDRVFFLSENDCLFTISMNEL